MADKKRPVSKPKKTTAKKAPKTTEVLETKTEEQEEDLMDAQSSPENHSLKGNGHHPDQNDYEQEEELDEDRQPDFGGPSRPMGNGVRSQDVRLSDEYTIETHFDKGQRLFIATVVEYPELRCTGHTRDEAMVDLEERLEDHVYDLKARGTQPVEAVQSRQFPERLDLPLSQSLYKKLDALSRHEKLPIDRLVAELLSAAMEKRGQARPQQNQQQQHHHRDNQGHHGQNRHHGGHRHQGGNRQQRGGGNNYRALDSRENFMEYVRNLEKGGGPGWKKR